MRMLMGLCLSLLIVTPAWATGTATTASKVFAAVSPSIVVVEAFDAKGHAVALGSGVVIAKGVVVSNCHVFEEAGTHTASVFYLKKRLPAELRYGDPTHDLCSFTVKGLTAPPVKMGATAALKVGENAYAVGAPEGLDLTLSNGIVSSLRKIPGGTVIQTTAPISPGSSGGGLFDSEGRLIGITSYYEKEGQQLNFALPVEWIKALPQHGKTPKELASTKPKARTDFHKGVKAELSGDYATALSIFRPLAEHGNAGAQSQLGWMYDNGQGVAQNHAKAVYWWRKAAAQGDVGSQFNLGLMYAHGNGVPQDYGKAIYWYRKAAAQGMWVAQFNLGAMYANGDGMPQDYAKALYWYRKVAALGVAAAQSNLGAMYANGHGVRQDYAKAVYWFRKAAAQGVADAQFNLGLMYDNGDGVPQSYAEALYWYRMAAKQGYIDAQINLGLMYAHGNGAPQDDAKAVYWYRKAADQGNVAAQLSLGARYTLGRGVPQDYAQAAKWYILAQAGGDENASKGLSLLERVMTPSQISEAQRLAREWWKAHHKQQ